MRFSTVTLCFALQASPAFAQTAIPAVPQAQVTFYSNGNFWTSGLPGAKSGIFAGALFDENQPLAYIRRNRFVTFHLAAGAHVFSASFSNHPARNSQMSLDLAANGSYFIRAVAESRGVVVVDFTKGRLDSVTCQVAHQEAEKALPLEAKHIPQAAIANVDSILSMPSCGSLHP